MIILKQNSVFNIYETDESGLATGSPLFSTRDRYEADAWLAEHQPEPESDHPANLDTAENVELPTPPADETPVEAQAEKANDKPKSSKSKKST